MLGQRVRLLTKKPGQQLSHTTFDLQYLFLASYGETIVAHNFWEWSMNVNLRFTPWEGIPCPKFPVWPENGNWKTYRPRAESNMTGQNKSKTKHQPNKKETGEKQKKKRKRKWILMIFCYSYRSVPCPDLIRKASSGSRCKQVQRARVNYYAENLNLRSPMGSSP